MQLKKALKMLAAGVLAAGLAVGLAACGGGGPRTVEVDPEGVNRPSDGQHDRNPSWLERLMGQDPRPNAGPCPLMGVLYDNARLVEFSQPGQERYANIAFTGEVEGVRGLCRYVGSDPIRMAMEINMAFGRGPAAQADRRTYRYWVAVTRGGQVPIAKQYFDVDVQFPAGQSVVRRAERVDNIVIPRANDTISGVNFEILVGLELTPEQLQFNRDGKRFRMDAVTETPAQ
ncbi:MAG: Tat pathway signal sequence domain protein [Hyphomonadaceae bacterium]